MVEHTPCHFSTVRRGAWEQAPGDDEKKIRPARNGRTNEAIGTGQGGL